MKHETIIAAARFHRLAEVAARNGGFWVSAGGGTANVIAGEIARATGDLFHETHAALEHTGGQDWYSNMYQAQPFNGEPEGYRFDARTVARAACRNV